MDRDRGIDDGVEMYCSGAYDKSIACSTDPFGLVGILPV